MPDWNAITPEYVETLTYDELFELYEPGMPDHVIDIVWDAQMGRPLAERLASYEKQMERESREMAPVDRKAWADWSAMKVPEAERRRKKLHNQDVKRRVDRFLCRLNQPCERCGRRFTPARSDGLYCSQSCRQKAARKRARQDRPAKAKCVRCGRKFKLTRSDRQHCTAKCRQAAYRERILRIAATAHPSRVAVTQL